MPKTMNEYVREIREVNARFRKLKKHDGKLGDRLAERKDALIDAMQKEHRHRAVYETAGSPSNGPFGLGGGPQRFCAGCGLAEQHAVPDGYAVLGQVRAVSVEHDDFTVIQSRALKRLGINIL